MKNALNFKCRYFFAAAALFCFAGFSCKKDETIGYLEVNANKIQWSYLRYPAPLAFDLNAECICKGGNIEQKAIFNISVCPMFAHPPKTGNASKTCKQVWTQDLRTLDWAGQNTDLTHVVNVEDCEMFDLEIYLQSYNLNTSKFEYVYLTPVGGKVDPSSCKIAFDPQFKITNPRALVIKTKTKIDPGVISSEYSGLPVTQIEWEESIDCNDPKNWCQ